MTTLLPRLAAAGVGMMAPSAPLNADSQLNDVFWRLKPRWYLDYLFH
jgi:hypothetical protein